MANRINISELLKDCPEGMELDCTVLEDLEFDGIVDSKYAPIRCRVKNPNGGYYVYNFTKYGCWFNTTFAKCVIFPKNKNTWEGFHRPFKDGDIAISESGDIHLLQTSSSSYCSYRESWEILHKFDSAITTNVTIVRLATEEEKQKLFQAIKDNGYHWNEETKTLEKLVEPKFKVGDKIVHKAYKEPPFTITEITDTSYKGGYRYEVLIEQQDNFELVPNKFDITTLKPFDKVLVRDFDNTPWEIEWFSRLLDGKHFKCFELSYVQCIPYEGNEHLLGKKDDCDEYFKIWE